MISLIVNADDLGINPERDRGIFEAFGRGIVTSTSLIANGSSFATAVRQAAEVGLAVGVHLNLSEGRPLTGPIPGLTGPSGLLPGKLEMRDYLCGGQCDLPGLRRELGAQIEKVLASGVEPGHIDGHQHCQIYPGLTALVIDLAREYGLDAMRSSRPADPVDADIPEALQDELRLFRRLGRTAHAAIRAAGLRCPDGLWGLPLLHSLNTPVLCDLLRTLGEGFWELMVHPGYPVANGRPFENNQRQSERIALTSAPVRQLIEQRGIRLCTYRDVPCGF